MLASVLKIPEGEAIGPRHQNSNQFPKDRLLRVHLSSLLRVLYRNNETPQQQKPLSLGSPGPHHSYSPQSFPLPLFSRPTTLRTSSSLTAALWLPSLFSSVFGSAKGCIQNLAPTKCVPTVDCISSLLSLQAYPS